MNHDASGRLGFRKLTLLVHAGERKGGGVMACLCIQRFVFSSRDVSQNLVVVVAVVVDGVVLCTRQSANFYNEHNLGALHKLPVSLFTLSCKTFPQIDRLERKVEHTLTHRYSE